MIHRLAVILLLLPAPLWAQTLPALYDVAGVAADDTLSIRAAPGAQAPKIGALPNDKRGVEVVALNPAGTWGRITWGEGTGWVSMRYLARRADTPQAPLAPRLRCFGTEPFWSLHIVQGALAEFEEPGMETPMSGSPRLVPSRNHPGRWGVLLSSGAATIRSEQCSDGMSDRAFGLSVDLVLNQDGNTALYSGCCSLHDF